MTTTSDTVHDNSHLVAIPEWERIVREAEEVVRGAAAPHLLGLGRSAFPSVTGFVQAKYHGGTQTPTFAVLHSAETPLQIGYASAIANYFTRNTNETSATFMLDPGSTLQLLDTSLVAWHCGNGNTRSVGVEQAGYAALTRAQWLTAPGLAQIKRLAALMHDLKDAHGIGTYFMSDAQLLDAYHGKIIGGWTTHDQCRRVLGGTTHTDPMPNYPFDVLMTTVNGVPVPPPAPQPTFPRPPRLKWILPRGHYVGDINGDKFSHGGDPRYDSQAIRDLVKNVQEWLIYRGCVPGVTHWEKSNWDDGHFTRPYSTDAAIRWHAKFYRGQPKPDQIWSDDYARLTA